MQPVGTLPHSQVPATCSYPEPDQSSRCLTVPLRKDTLFNINASHLRLGLPSGLFPSGLLTRTPVCNSAVSHACHVPCPSHSSWFAHPNIWQVMQILRLLFMYYSPTPVTSSHLHPTNYLCQHPVLRLWSLLNVSDQVSHPYKTTDLYVLIPKLFVILLRFMWGGHCGKVCWMELGANWLVHQECVCSLVSLRSFEREHD